MLLVVPAHLIFNLIGHLFVSANPFYGSTEGIPAEITEYGLSTIQQFYANKSILIGLMLPCGLIPFQHTYII